ncbi:hypothetical protein, partial [Reinekea blandensis]
MSRQHPESETIALASMKAVRDSIPALARDRYAALIRASLVLMAATGVGLVGPLLLGKIIDALSMTDESWL